MRTYLLAARTSFIWTFAALILAFWPNCVYDAKRPDRFAGTEDCTQAQWVDRINESWIVLVDRAGNEYNLPESVLPPGAAEGLVWLHNAWTTTCKERLANRVQRNLARLVRKHQPVPTSSGDANPLRNEVLDLGTPEEYIPSPYRRR